MLGARPNPESDPHIEHHDDGHRDDKKDARRHLPERETARSRSKQAAKGGLRDLGAICQRGSTQCITW